MMKHDLNFLPKNANLSIKIIEENIKQKILDISTQIDMEENSCEIENNIIDKILSTIYINSKKYLEMTVKSVNHIEIYQKILFLVEGFPLKNLFLLGTLNHKVLQVSVKFL